MPYEALEGCAWVTIAASQEALEHAERSDLARKDIQDNINDRVGPLFRMLQARTMRGQIEAAFRVLEQAGTNPIVEVHAARFVMMFHLSGFPNSAAASKAVSVMAESADYDDHFWLGAKAAADGRWNDVELAGLILDSLARELAADGKPTSGGHAQAEGDALRAYLGLLRGEQGRLPEFEEAMLRLAPWGYNSESVAYYLRYQVGKVLFDDGDFREAERYFQSFNQFQWMYLVPSHYYLGRIYEEMDRPDDAAYHYGLFVEWWRNADPALRPWWEEGRDALARVTGEPRQ
jgi:tetratricopeptide (TPR) repeat protein